MIPKITNFQISKLPKFGNMRRPCVIMKPNIWNFGVLRVWLLEEEELGDEEGFDSDFATKLLVYYAVPYIS